MKLTLPFVARVFCVLLCPLFALSANGQVPASPAGAPVTYQLPIDGPLPLTYRVTIAIVDAKNPDWIVSQFICGGARTVTKENGGKFTEKWDGLDDNFMPVPPGTYGIKGIYMPAQQWPVDKEWHSITPRFAGGASSWMPPVDDWQKPEPFGGDPVGSPFADVAVGPNGVAVFYYQYLENGLNNPMFDLKKPLGYEQFLRAFNSGGAGGGTSVATDGETVWAFSTDGGPKYVYRADGKSFGKAEGANRPNSYPPEGWVTAMAVWRDPAAAKAFVYVAQRGKIEDLGKKRFRESDTVAVDKITVHDGDDGKVLAALPLARPCGLAVQGGVLYALHGEGSGFAVSAAKITGGLPGGWQRVFAVPTKIQPADLEVDSHGRFYLSDSAANKVFQLDRAGKVLRSYGRLDAQKPGAYDRETFIAPAKLATWTDPQGEDRLIVVENGGPNRATEWSADGKLLREFMTLQTHANDGYGFDPEHPEHVYLPGQQGWLTRFHVDYATRQWTIDAVWPGLENEPRAGILDRLQFIRRDGRIYLAGRRSFNIYRLEADRVVPSAAILRERKDPTKPPTMSYWHDANGNARVDDDEITPAELPGTVLTYHGQNWLEDLSLLAPAQGGQDLWRLAPGGFDAHGNPIFKEWQKVLTDPIFVARAAGTADTVHGGNELAEKYTSDWMGADGSAVEGFYVQARGGKNFSANEGAQHKITRYVPDGAGGFKLKWRTGRTALDRLAETGEFYGGMRIQRPINGLLSVIDQSRCGVLLYNEDGLYVDTIFPDGRRFPGKNAGIYPQPGEFFAGQVFPNKTNGKIYVAMGKYTPTLFEVEGWSLRENPVRPLTTLSKSVTISAAQIATPPEIALSLRGGAGSAKLARFAPALGTLAMDGSLNGWESAEPVVFRADKEQSVEVRCLYRPDHLFLRWHARLATKFEPKAMPPPERIFTHDRLADTFSFYFQGDANAAPNGPPAGRPGDARLIFGIFQDKAGTVQPIGVGLYPEWKGPGKASPQVYRTPVGEAAFAHVGPIANARLTHTIDADGKGFVLVAAIPRTALPRATAPFDASTKRLVNFEATFGGHNKFWWANSDGSASRETYDEPTEARLYPGSWAPATFQGIEGGVTVKNWLVCGPFGGSGAEQFKSDPNGKMPGSNKDMKVAVREFCEAASYPPDNGQVDLAATFTGEMIQGYWNDPRKVQWKPASVAELDSRVILGTGAQTWYGATWIYAPAAAELEFQFHSSPQAILRWFVNGTQVVMKNIAEEKGGPNHVFFRKTLPLRAGWNQIMLRAYCTGYSPFRAGLVLNGTPEKLWDLQLSATPPAKQP
jgi:hypothetical protein